MLKIIKKADIVLFIVLVALGVALSALSFANRGTAGSQIEVTLDGNYYGTYNLSENQEIIVESGGHQNKIIIEDGYVRMESADCHNQLCVRAGRIKNVNETIVCLPNRVMIRVIGEEADVDAVSG